MLYRHKEAITDGRENALGVDPERVVWNIRAVGVLTPAMVLLSYFTGLGLVPQVLFWGAALILFMAFISLVHDGGTLIEQSMASPSTSSHDASNHDAASHDASSHDASSHDASSHDASSHDASSHDASSHDASSHDASSHDASNPSMSVNRVFGRASQLQLLVGLAIYLAPHLAVYGVSLLTPEALVTPFTPAAPAGSAVLGGGDLALGDLGAVFVATVSALIPVVIAMVLSILPFLVLMMLLPAAFFFLPSAINMLFINVSLGTFAMAYTLLLVTINIVEVLAYALVLLPFVFLSTVLAFAANHHPKGYSRRRK